MAKVPIASVPLKTLYLAMFLKLAWSWIRTHEMAMRFEVVLRAGSVAYFPFQVLPSQAG